MQAQGLKLVRPQRKRTSQTNITDEPSQIIVDQFTIDTMKDIILNLQTSDWKARLDILPTLFDFLLKNEAILTRNSKFQELADTVCKVLSDSNGKI